MSYGRVQRQSARRPAGPYDRPRNTMQPSPSSIADQSSSVPFLSRIFNSVYGLFRPVQDHDECPEKPNSAAEPIEERSDSPPRQPRIPAPSCEWQGVPIDEMAYGELRRVCLEEGLRISEDRDVMLADLRRHIEMQKETRRSEGVNKRRLSNDNPSLDQVMMKKAKTGFSRDEFEKYMALMKNNLKVTDEDFGKFSPGSLSPSETPREIRRHSLPKRVPTPFAHISSHRPSRRDSFSGPGTIGPIHLSFPSTSTTAEDLHDLSNSSKTARSVLSSISSMSAPLIQSNELLAKKRLQSRRPFNPYAQVGPVPAKPPFKVPPPVPKPPQEPVKASHKLDADNMLKKSREDSSKTRSASPPAKRKAPASSESVHAAFKPISADAPVAAHAVSTSPQPFQFSVPSPSPTMAQKPTPALRTSGLMSTPASADQPSEEAICPVCELPLDDVDHSDCNTGESSPGSKPSAAPVSGFSFGKPSEPPPATGFSFQLPNFPETAKNDAASKFSFELPKPTEASKPTETPFKFSFSAAADAGGDAQKPSQAPPSPPKFSFGLSGSAQSKPEDKVAEVKPAGSLFSSSLSTAPLGPGATNPLADSKSASLEYDIKQTSSRSSDNTLSAAPNPSFSFTPSSSSSAKADLTISSKAEEPLVSSSSVGSQGQSGQAGNQTISSEPASLSTPASSGFSFNLPGVASAPSAATDLTKKGNLALAESAPSFGFKFDAKPKEANQTDSTLQQSSVTSFQIDNASTPSAPFQFGATSKDISAPAASTSSAAPAFQLGNSAPSNPPASQPNFSFGGSGSLPSFGASVPANSTFGASVPSSSGPAFQFESKPSTSSGFSFGATESGAPAASNSLFKFGVTDATPTSATPSSTSGFSIGGPMTQPSQPSNSMQDSASMTNNMASLAPTPAFSFGSSLAPSMSTGFGQNATPPSSVFGQTPALPQNPAFGFGVGMKTAPSSMDGFQSGSNLAFAQTAPPATPSSSFSFTPSTPSSTFVPSINFDAPVPDGLGGSFSHGMAPQGRPMVKAKRVARKR